MLKRLRAWFRAWEQPTEEDRVLAEWEEWERVAQQRAGGRFTPREANPDDVLAILSPGRVVEPPGIRFRDHDFTVSIDDCPACQGENG